MVWDSPEIANTRKTVCVSPAIFSQGENPAVYGGRESDTCWPVHRWHSGRIFHGNPQLL